jgi:hypothetical protein
MIQFRMVPLRRSLGQAEEWKARAQKAVDQYEELLRQASMIADEKTYAEILVWVGNSNMPGSPAERYFVVSKDLQESVSGPVDSEQVAGRTARLELLNDQLYGKVNFALQAYGSLPAPGERAGGKPERASTATWCAIGGIALLGLVIMPLLLD